MKLPPQVAMVCPLCQKPADLQGTGRGADHHLFHLYCHECATKIEVQVRIRPHTMNEIIKDRRWGCRHIYQAVGADGKCALCRGR